MSSSTLSSLNAQRTTVLAGMDGARLQIAELEEKIAKLKKASGKLAKSISVLQSTKGSIDSLKTVGKERRRINLRSVIVNTKKSVKEYISKTEDAQEAIQDDIKRYESLKTSLTTGLHNLEITLDSLNSQIASAEKE